MITNDIIFKVKTALKLSNSAILKIYELADFPMSEPQLNKILKKQQDKDFITCKYDELGAFFDGLIIFKRRASKNKKSSNETIELTNNLMLKKLRIALELKEAETEIIFSLGEAELTKQQLASLFRKESNKNFKICSDELFISFLDGLNEFYYTGEEV
jgi:uncharacterized protein YehS (DUF1456 family)